MFFFWDVSFHLKLIVHVVSCYIFPLMSHFTQNANGEAAYFIFGGKYTAALNTKINFIQLIMNENLPCLRLHTCNSWMSSNKCPTIEYYTLCTIHWPVSALVPANVENLRQRSDLLLGTAQDLCHKWGMFEFHWLIMWFSKSESRYLPVWCRVTSSWSKRRFAFHHQWCFVWVNFASR